MANFSIYLPDQLKNQLDDKAEQSGESRNQIIRTAVEAYLEEGKMSKIYLPKSIPGAHKTTVDKLTSKRINCKDLVIKKLESDFGRVQKGNVPPNQVTSSE